MNPVLKYIGYTIIAYMFLWILYMIFVSIKIYIDKYGYPYFMKFLSKQ